MRTVAKEMPPKGVDIVAALQKLRRDWAEPALVTDVATCREQLTDALLEGIMPEVERALEILDGMTLESTFALSLSQVAYLAAEALRATEKERDRLDDEVDELREAAAGDGDVHDGYHAFATALGWRYPDGEPMPTWEQLDDDTQRAFRAFARNCHG